MDKCKSITEIWIQVITLLKDGPTFPLRCQLIVFVICYKLASSGLPSGKQDLKELQEAAWKVCLCIDLNPRRKNLKPGRTSFDQ